MTLRIAQRGSPAEWTRFTIPAAPSAHTGSISRRTILFATLAALGIIVLLILLTKAISKSSRQPPVSRPRPRVDRRR